MDKFREPEQFDAAVEIHGGEPFAVWAPAVNGSHVKAELYFAMLAELEAKDKRIAELEAEITNIVDSHAETVAELRAKLATPVRLPDMRQSSSGDRYQWSDGAHNYRLDVISMLLGAGFTVAVEGDE